MQLYRQPQPPSPPRASSHTVCSHLPCTPPHPQMTYYPMFSVVIVLEWLSNSLMWLPYPWALACLHLTWMPQSLWWMQSAVYRCYVQYIHRAAITHESTERESITQRLGRVQFCSCGYQWPCYPLRCPALFRTQAQSLVRIPEVYISMVTSESSVSHTFLQSNRCLVVTSWNCCCFWCSQVLLSVTLATWHFVACNW